MPPRHSRAFWDDIAAAYVEGEAGVYPSIEVLAERFHVTVKAIVRRSMAEGWAARRVEWQRASAPLKARQEVEASIKSRQVSNNAWATLARALRNQATRVMNAAQTEDKPMPLAEALGWTRVMKDAQAVERLAAGEVPALVDDREQVEATIIEIQARLAKMGGSEGMSTAEKVEALSKLTLSQALMLFGVSTEEPKKTP